MTHAFMVPGEGFLPLIDALDSHPAVRLVSTRHEGGASFMAAAHARLTGRLTACLASRIPGAGNLAIGLHTALVDGCPVVALVGQVTTENRHRGAFQEVDLSGFLAPVTKWLAEPPTADRIVELGQRAVQTTLLDRPGPSALLLAQDVLDQRVPPGIPNKIDLPRSSAHPEQVGAVLAMLRTARSPIMWVGGGVIDADATPIVESIAESEEIPVLAAWRRPDAFPNSHRLYLGQSGLGSPPSVLRRLLEADFILAIGTELGQLSTFQYEALRGGATLIHVSGHSDGLGGPFSNTISILSDPGFFLSELLRAARAEPMQTTVADVRRPQNATYRAQWLTESTPSSIGRRPGYVDQEVLAYHMRSLIPDDAIITNDAGIFSSWVGRYITRERPRTYLAPTSGAMGYAIPAAIAASLARPTRPVVAIAGDGGFLMTGAEIETAVRERAPITGVVVDNGQYGTIRFHQERVQPAHFPGSTLGPIDFAGYARSLGGAGITVSEEGEVAGALIEAIHADVPTVVHVRVDPAQLDIQSDAPDG